MRFLLAMLMTAGLIAQGDTWQTFPSPNGAPDVLYRVQEEGEGLRLEIQPRGVDTTKWALHLWMGDPGMVAARKSQLQKVRKSIQWARDQMKDGYHDDPGCKERIQTFLNEAQGALQAFGSYDPYQHVRIPLPGSPTSPGSDAQGPILAVLHTDRGMTIWRAELPFRGGFDASRIELKKLSLGLAYLPASDVGHPALRAPVDFPLSTPWHLQPLLAKGASRLLAVEGSADSTQPLLWQSDGYHLARIGEVSEPGCFGAEGYFGCPSPWNLVPADDEVNLSSNSRRFSFSFAKGAGTSLIVQKSASDTPTLVDISKHVGSEGEEGMDLLDGSDASDATYVLLQVTGYSRPDAPMGYCGAGEEVNLVWLKLGLDGHLLKADSFLTESCLDSIEAESSHPEDGPWTWEWDDPRVGHHEKAVHHLLRYDPDHPERGLVDQTSPVPKN